MNKNVLEIYFTGKNYSAYLPSLLGCVSVGSTPNEIQENIKEAIHLHLQGMREDGDDIPEFFKGDYELEYKFHM